jgi:hypothetical protein
VMFATLTCANAGAALSADKAMSASVFFIGSLNPLVNDERHVPGDLVGALPLVACVQHETHL